MSYALIQACYIDVDFYEPCKSCVIFRVRVSGCASSSEVTFDLDRKVIRGLDRSMFQINRYTRTSLQEKWRKLNQITVRMTATEPRTRFSDFSGFKTWLDSGFGNLFPQDRESVRSEKATIALDFHCNVEANLRDLRVNALGLVRHTWRLYKESNIRFELRCTSHGVLSMINHEITLKDLRNEIFILLSKTIQKYPESADSFCPSVRVDGEGVAVEAAKGSLPDQPQQYILKTDAGMCCSDITEAARSFAESLEVRSEEALKGRHSTRYNVPAKDVSLRAMWEELVDIDDGYRW